ncbi:MAG: hypothetical protein A2W11_05380 [Ignavibacteria bacterium RBG_16_35_7]|nr:MAG: hypothetical protein A2W11_05380 [Ignavibacteria bacterium RBG_16_35_7]
MKIIKGTFILSIFSLLLLFHFQVFPQNKIAFSLISSGGGQQANSAYTINGSLGQTIIGNGENTIHQAHAGFWQMYYQNVMVNVPDDDLLPIEFKLEQNYPNPFNPSTIIKFGIPEQSIVLIKIYDVLGSEVKTLLNQEMDKGWYELLFNAAGYSSGIYIYRMQAGSYANTKKMLMIK